MKLTKELLERYMKQNPKKYMAKFGGKTHEQILSEQELKLQASSGLMPEPKPEVKVSISASEQVETSFTSAPDAETVQMQAKVQERIIKRGRKPNAQ